MTRAASVNSSLHQASEQHRPPADAAVGRLAAIRALPDEQLDAVLRRVETSSVSAAVRLFLRGA